MVAVLLAGLLAAAQPSSVAAPAMTALIETIDITAPAISPDGRWVAYRQGQASIGANRYGLSWWVTPIDGSAAPRKVGDGGLAIWRTEGVQINEFPVWSSDSRWIYYRALKDGQVQVWRARADGHGEQAVTHDDADIDRFALGQDNRLTYVVRATREAILDAERAAYDAGVRIDETIDPSQSLTAAVEINGRMASQRLLGRWFQRTGILGRAPDQARTVDLETLALVPAQADAAPEKPPIPDVFADVQVYMKGGSPQGEVRLVMRSGRIVLEIQRPNGEIITCDAKPCLGQGPSWAAWRPGRDEVVIATQGETARTDLWSWTPGRGVRPILQDAGALSPGTPSEPCAISAEAAICVAADILEPPRLQRIDLASGRRTTLAAPNPPAVPGDIVAEHLVWRDREGRAFSGDLLRKRGTTHSPLFVNYYSCGGYLRGGIGDEWPFITLADAGIAALCVNTTRDPRSQLDNVADYDAAQTGIEAAIALLDARGLIDTRRIGMGGLSKGSEVTMWVARRTKLLAAASITSVQLEPAYYWLNGVAGRDVHAGLRQAWKLGAPDETPERWKQLSPALNVDAIKAPLLMQMPEQEFRPTIELFARLSNSTTPVDLYVFPQEAHVLAQPRHRLSAYQRNLDWFRFWLQDQIDPDPAKAEQYRRWIAARDRRPGG